MYYVLSFEVHILQEKWRDAFDFGDVNDDGVQDLVDVDLEIDNYIRLHNLTAEEVCDNIKYKRNVTPYHWYKNRHA